VGTTSQTLTFSMQNTGGQWMFTSDVYVSDRRAPYQILATTCRFIMLNPGQSCTVSVVFSPTVTGDFGASIEIDYSPQGSGPTYVLAGLAGRGVTQYSPPMLSFGAAQLNMSQTQYGHDGAIYGVTLRNNGPSPAQISGLSASGDFSVYSTDCGPITTTPSVNVAAASMGGVPAASSVYAPGYTAVAVNDSSRTGAVWGQDGGWATPTLASWSNITFPEAKTIDRITVYSIQDNFSSPIEPTDNLTFSLYGLTDFTVYGFTNAWIPLVTITGNRLVKRTVTFPPISVSAVSVNPGGSPDGWSRLAEIEAWTPASTASGTTTLPNGSQCMVYVRFTPTALGPRTGWLQAESNGIASPNLLQLVGTGVGATFASAPIDGSNAGSPKNTDNVGTSIQTAFAPDDRPGGGSGILAPGGAGGAANTFALKDEGVHDGGRIDVFPPSWCEAFPEDCSNDPDFGSSLPRQPLEKPKEPRDADCESEDDASAVQLQDRLLAMLRSRDETERRLGSRNDIGMNLASARGEFVFDPIHAGHGNKYHVQRDYQGAGAFGLNATRTFNSQAFPASAQRNVLIGTGWFLNWDRSVKRTGDIAVVTRGDGKSFQFTYNAATGAWDPTLRVSSRLAHVADATGAVVGWRYTTRDQAVENFDAKGRLSSVVMPAGQSFNVAYDGFGRLATVTDPVGRRIAFAYDAAGRVSAMSDPAYGQTTYGYDARGRLSIVRYPDGRSRQYQYNDPNNVFALTSVIDELGQVYATFSYDAAGRATGNSFIGGVGAGSVSYSAGGSSATTPDGTVWSRGFGVNNGLVQMTTLTPSCTTCGIGSEQFGYDPAGMLTSYLDRTGTQTSIAYNTRGLVTSVTEANGRSPSRVTSVTWDPTFPVPTQVSQTGALTRSYQYDAQGRITQESLSDGVTTRAKSYAYNAQGLLSQVDGPRTDVADVTSYTYDAAGNIATITNAKGHVTRYNSYDAHGRPLSFTFPDGTTGTMSYDARGRLLSKSRAGRTTSYAYNAFGQVATQTDPGGVVTGYLYDAAHRLVGVDKPGEKLRYTLDNSGRTTKVESFDATNFLVSTSSAEYDGLGRLTRTVGSKGQVTAYSYDGNGNLTQTVNPNAESSQVAFDSLNRPYLFTNALGGQVRKTLDAQGRLMSVQDVIGVTTSFTYNSYGDLVQVQSGDAGATNMTVDPSSNVTSVTDGAGMTAQYAYDAIGRRVQATFSGMPGTTFTYDVAANGVGQLAQVVEPEATTTFSYDANAHTASITQTTGTVSRSIVYGRDSIGRITSMRYPSGRTLSLTYANDRVASMSLDGISIVSGVQYFPFGSAESWIFGHGTEYTRYLDTDKRVGRYLVPGGDRALTYDSAGRLLRITETIGGSARIQAFAYDSLGRMTTFQGFTSTAANESQSFTYDGNGNRLAKTLNGITETYGYVAGTNRIAGSTINGAVASTYMHDGRGSVVSDGVRTFGYLASGRLGSANGGAASYGYNWMGLRVRKTLGGQARYFMYDDAMRLIGEYDASGNAIQEFVWLGTVPVAVSAVLPGSAAVDIGYIWTDHLDTPRIITKEDGASVGPWSMAKVWAWDSLPFGETVPDVNPSGLGAFTFNLRLPGQYFDAETGLHYNNQRDYDPKTGRYLNVDRKGADDGANRFIYALADPVLNIDPKGENVWRCDRGIGSATNPIMRLPRIFPAVHEFICSGRSLSQATCIGISAGAFTDSTIDIQVEQADGASCSEVSKNACMDKCVLGKLAAMRGSPFDIRSSVSNGLRRRGFNNCQTGANSVIDQCLLECARE